MVMPLNLTSIPCSHIIKAYADWHCNRLVKLSFHSVTWNLESISALNISKMTGFSYQNHQQVRNLMVRQQGIVIMRIINGEFTASIT